MGKTLINERYELRGQIGSGGMGHVYLAHDEVLDRDVALKLLKGRYAENKEFVERFRREAKSAASLSHPHIVPVFDGGETEDGTYYIAMEYLSGGTLRDLIASGRTLPPRAVVEVALEIAEALQAAHTRGVIHRDIKPRNILITDSGHVKVADFGIARAAEATTISDLGDILGSAKYMSPEQAAGDRVGPASDLYSLGVVLFKMLTGNVPFEVETPADVPVEHAGGPPPHPREVNPRVPGDMDALVMKLLASDPEDRYASATQLIKELRRVRDGLPPLLRRGGDHRRFEHPGGPRHSGVRARRDRAGQEEVVPDHGGFRVPRPARCCWRRCGLEPVAGFRRSRHSRDFERHTQRTVQGSWEKAVRTRGGQGFWRRGLDGAGGARAHRGRRFRHRGQAPEKPRGRLRQGARAVGARREGG
jgi:serine/threonine protein kinase